MYKIVAKLKQHTPMLHFQYERDNISLRASDFKPRFDKYLLTLGKYYTGEELKECLPGIEKLRKNMNSNEKKKALYSTRFGPLINIREKHLLLDPLPKPGKKQNKNTLYFGDIDRIVLSDEVELILKTFDREIGLCIAKALPIFFAFENFGTRQNKGFGSFTLESIHINNQFKNFKKLHELLGDHTLHDIYSFTVDYEKLDSEEKRFQTFYKSLKTIYSTIKAGINFDFNKDDPEKYSKSLLWKYLNREKIPLDLWEKRIIKMFMKGDDLKKVETERKKMFRILLGMSDNYKFVKKPVEARMDIDYGDRRTVNIDRDRVFSVINNKIKRAPSPLFFKPILDEANTKFIVYLILKHELYFEETMDERRGAIGSNLEIDIRKEKYTIKEGATIVEENIPTIHDFDLRSFMRYVVNEFNNQANAIINSFVAGLRFSKVNNLTEAGNQ